MSTRPMPSRPDLRRWFGALALACLLVGLQAAPAAAHAVLTSTTPRADEVIAEAPEVVTASFNEPVEIAFGALRVFDTNAARVDLDDAAHGATSDTIQVSLPGDLASGTYTATYRVVSADSHPVQGAFVFHVGEPGSQPQGIGAQLLGDGDDRPLEQVLLTIARFANFTGLLMLGGAFAFAMLLWRRKDASARRGDVDERFQDRWKRVVTWSFVTVLVATIALVILQGSIAADVSIARAATPGVLGDLLGTRYGVVHAVKFVVLLVLGGAWWAGVRAPLLAGAALLFLLATPGLAGHAGVTEPVWLNVPADVLHMAAAAAWLGGLVILTGVAFPATRIAEGRRTQLMAPVVSRFSDLAVVSIAVLVVTGIYRAWVEVQALRALTGAPYGRVLIVKLAVFVPLLVLGAVNNRWIKPRIASAGERGDEADGALATLRRLIGIEVVLGLVVVAVTAILVNLTPARVEAGVTGPFITDVRFGNDNLNLVVDPNRVGENIVHLTITTPEGAPREVESMRIEFRMPEEGIGPIVSEGVELGPGHFIVQGRELSVPGRWSLTISATLDRFTDVRTEVEVDVNR